MPGPTLAFGRVGFQVGFASQHGRVTTLWLFRTTCQQMALRKAEEGKKWISKGTR